MIGLTIMTHFVYWYRGWKSSDISELKRRQLLENEFNQINESPELPLPDYLPPDDYDQPQMERGNNHGLLVLRTNRGRPALDPDDDGLAIPQNHGENMFISADNTSSSTSNAQQRRMGYDLAKMERLLID